MWFRAPSLQLEASSLLSASSPSSSWTRPPPAQLTKNPNPPPPPGLILYPSLPLSPRTLACQLVAHEVPDSHGAGAERHSGRVVGGGAAALRGEEVGAVRRELGRAAG